MEDVRSSLIVCHLLPVCVTAYAVLLLNATSTPLSLRVSFVKFAWILRGVGTTSWKETSTLQLTL